LLFVLERQGLEKKFFELCTEVVSEFGLEIYALDYLPGSHVLRVFIQDPETKTAVLDNCKSVDRKMTPFIEELEWMPAELTLEVSSPGVYRDIKEGVHFIESVGQRINLGLNRKLEAKDITENSNAPSCKKVGIGQKKILANLIEVSGEDFLFEYEGEFKFKINIEDIKKANVEPLWEDIKES
jgi:ribosome maturation factor RimP